MKCCVASFEETLPATVFQPVRAPVIYAVSFHPSLDKTQCIGQISASQKRSVKDDRENMFGQMQDVPLLMNRILDHAMVNHSEREIVSRLVEGNIHRETYAELHLRARKLSQALKSIGIGEQDVIATFATDTAILKLGMALPALGRLSHAQSAPVCRAIGLYHQPCGR